MLLLRSNGIKKNPDNTIAHGEIIIGDTVVMVSEENPQYNKSPKTLNGTPVNLCVYVPDVDTVVQKAIENGARVLIPVEDQFMVTGADELRIHLVIYGLFLPI